MFSDFLKKKNIPPISEDHINQIMDEALDKAKEQDPLAAVRLGGKELVEMLMDGWQKTDERGIHIDSILGVLGSLAGFSCQMAIWELLVRTGKASISQILHTVEGLDGKKYYFGDFLNKPIFSTPYSLWNMTANALKAAGSETYPDAREIAAYTASVVGSEAFGKPRLPDGHNLSDVPIHYVQTFWPAFLPLLKKRCDSPTQWPILLGFSAYHVIVTYKEVIDPFIAATIVLECAIPTSKLDPIDLGLFK